MDNIDSISMEELENLCENKNDSIEKELILFKEEVDRRFDKILSILQK